MRMLLSYSHRKISDSLTLEDNCNNDGARSMSTFVQLSFITNKSSTPK